jgi:hypothetical protein
MAHSGHPRFTSAEIVRRGKEIYKKTIRNQVETEENIGKIVCIDIETGDYEVDETGIVASKRLHSRHPGAALWGERIGFDAVYAVGGTLTRTKKV